VTPYEAFSDALLPWIIRIAGLLWLVGAFMLFRQIRVEMALDRMTSRIEEMAREMRADLPPEGEDQGEDEDTYGDLDAPVRPRKTTAEEKATDAWIDRDDAARRGWIAGQAVVLAATAIAMMIMHPFAAWLTALLVLGQGVYFIWREHTARHAPTAEAAAHARPTPATVNAAWFSLVIATLVWAAAFRGLLK
jgi:ABC-type nickel/cobalt efflux system permease component RcnA